MIPKHLSLVPLRPARQAALQAIVEVEQRRAAGKNLPDNPHARAFMRLLTGCSRLSLRTARGIPGLCWEAYDHIYSLKQLEEGLDVLIRSHGEICHYPVPMDVQEILFPDVMYRRETRHTRRVALHSNKLRRLESKRICHEVMLQRNLLDQAETDLNFQTPETVSDWNDRWQDELSERDRELLFWRWQPRFASLAGLHWLRASGEPLWVVLHEIPFIVQETPEASKAAERWQVPNKLRYWPEAAA
ncbi:plasmid SOS inhibition protein A [Franconibacter daqui]|uniref:plasmid SOS inhibition protein A n=1 Tax=Franconibacter daqui TaxID=2047724 RepID=UPI002DBD5F3A|nr:plasmid SOS inhibition protein A [Franconibacter daqui]MEB5924813.1 plasmid SOS inhibition protein A [Franconibacter daqui]